MINRDFFLKCDGLFLLEMKNNHNYTLFSFLTITQCDSLIVTSLSKTEATVSKHANTNLWYWTFAGNIVLNKWIWAFSNGRQQITDIAIVTGAKQLSETWKLHCSSTTGAIHLYIYL